MFFKKDIAKEFELTKLSIDMEKASHERIVNEKIASFNRIKNDMITKARSEADKIRKSVYRQIEKLDKKRSKLSLVSSKADLQDEIAHHIENTKYEF